MEYTKITIAIQKGNMNPIMEIIDFKNNSILLRNLFDQYQISLPAEKMAEIKMIADVCEFERWEKLYEGTDEKVEWQLQIFNGKKSVKDSSGKNAVPECWTLFEDILKYCKLLVAGSSPNYSDPDDFPELCWKSDTSGE